LILFINNSRI